MAAPDPFAVTLRDLREAAGLTREAVASLSGGRVSAVMVGMVESGSRRPSWNTVEALADALALTGDDRSMFHAAAEAGGPLRRRESGPIPNVDYTAPEIVGPVQEAVAAAVRLAATASAADGAPASLVRLHVIEAVRRDLARHAHEAATVARAEGQQWRAIGEAAGGISRQAARERFRPKPR